MFTKVKSPLPWAVVEAYKSLILSPENQGTEAVTLMMAAAQFRGCKLEDPVAAVLRLEKFYEKQNSEPKAPEQPTRVSIGTDFNEWCEKSTIPELLLLANRHDYAAARRIYEQEDFEEVHEYLNHFLICYGKEKRYEMEVVMYGMGGHYKEDKPSSAGGPNTKVIDLNSTEGREEARARLKSLGF